MAFEVIDVIKRDTKLWKMLKAMPKVELHRHLEGAIQIETLLETAKKFNIPLPSDDIDILRPYVQMTREDAATSKQFLTKFSVLRQLFISEEVIRHISRSVVMDAAEDNIRYMELRFTPYAEAKLMGFAIPDVVDWVSDSVAQAAAEANIKVNLIVAMNRHESVDIGWEMLQASIDFQDRGVVAIDLCGNEIGHPADPFVEIFAEAERAGLGITVHAGEWQGAENVQYAIEKMGTTRIGHGVRAVEDSITLQYAVDNNIYFEVCPTSNLQTGVVNKLPQHPLIDLHYVKANITINTDDPAIHNICLTDEYALMMQGLGLPLSLVQQCILNAVRASFLPSNEQAALEEEFRAAMDVGMLPETEF